VLSGLMDRGAYGRLTSVVPPITVPAWSCMMASRTPGDLGVYGFRNRANHSYDALFIANATAIKEPRLWDYATRAGKPSIVLGVPGTYPPRPLNGVMVGCFLTPTIESPYTFPPMLKREIEQVVGEYVLDVRDFRTEDKDYLLRQVYEMTDRRFALAQHLLASKPWELFVMVEMGVDRMYHGFWKLMDPAHRKHEPGNRFEYAILDYHKHVDELMGSLLAHADEDTAVFVVSDHGGKRMDGGIRINEWLRREGLLGTLSDPETAVPLREAGIDWSRTTAWGEGGYYSRIFLNVQGREPEGTVPAAEYDRVRDDLARRIAAIPDENGNPLGTRVYMPEDVYPEVNGVAPDLIVHFGDLLWRSVGTVGGEEGIHVFENDTGPDDANHAQDGLFVLTAPGVEPGPREGAHLLDVAPTALELMGVDVPPSMRGTSLLASVPARP
jgi:predicted AlkP superfamily phosphohydrolase/phosphomutase